VATNRSGSTLPGGDLVSVGLRDLEHERESVEALLVSIAAPRLRGLGLQVPDPMPRPEERLYLLLAGQHGDAAHSRYNSLVRRLVSIERVAAALRRLEP